MDRVTFADAASAGECRDSRAPRTAGAFLIDCKIPDGQHPPIEDFRALENHGGTLAWDIPTAKMGECLDIKTRANSNTNTGILEDKRQHLDWPCPSSSHTSILSSAQASKPSFHKSSIYPIFY